MNKVILSGKVFNHPETTTFGNGLEKTVFTLAVDRYKSKEDREEAKRKNRNIVDFIKCEAWGNLSNIAKSYVKKGENLMLIGKLNLESYQKDDGSWITYTSIIAEELEF